MDVDCSLADVNQFCLMLVDRTVSIPSFNTAEIDGQMLSFWSMQKASDEIKKLRATTEASLRKTAELQQFLAKIEANLSRTENQKVSSKFGIKNNSL